MDVLRIMRGRLLFCSRPHLKLKIHRDSDIKLFNIHTKRVESLLKTTTGFVHSTTVNHSALCMTVHVSVTLISVGSESSSKVQHATRAITSNNSAQILKTTALLAKVMQFILTS